MTLLVTVLRRLGLPGGGTIVIVAQRELKARDKNLFCFQ